MAKILVWLYLYMNNGLVLDNSNKNLLILSKTDKTQAMNLAVPITDQVVFRQMIFTH